MEPTTQVIVGIAIGVGAPALWVVVKLSTRWFARTVSVQVVAAIGDSLQQRWRSDIDAALHDALEPINAELKTNGGTSLKDVISSIAMRLGNVEGQIEAWLNNGRNS